jgi:hypothetical protein
MRLGQIHLEKTILSGLLCILLSTKALAQEQAGDAAAAGADAAEVSAGASIIDKTKNDLMLITFAGLGGAVLGLSTLSFVEQPEKKLKNIVTGGALGIIAGVLFVAYKQATDTTGILEDADYKAAPVDPAPAQDFLWRRNILPDQFQNAPQNIAGLSNRAFNRDLMSMNLTFTF